MIKLSDFIALKLKEYNIDKVYGLTGGAVVHIFDSLHSNNVDVTFMNHEQAAAFAAVGHSKLTNDYSCCVVTTGPGVTNALTGLAGAWLDSVPVIFISGQSRLNQTTNIHKNIRQIGTQQLNVLPIVNSMTKYSVMLTDPGQINYELEKCLFIAKSGRPGPVWIDVPIDLQWAMIEPAQLKSYFTEQKEKHLEKRPSFNGKLVKLVSLIKKAKYPLILLGNGARISDSKNEIKFIIEKFNIPFVTTWLAADMFSFDYELNAGRVGLAGQRGANIAIQNSDLLIVLGSHLPIPVTGSNTDVFSRKSKKVIVDIDKDEIKLKKKLFDIVIDADLKVFCQEFIDYLNVAKLNTDTTYKKHWLKHIQKLKQYNYEHTLKIVSDEKPEMINQYVFVNYLSTQLGQDDKFVIDGGGTNVYVSFQGIKISGNQRLLLSTSLCSMGSGIPEAIGVYQANDKGDVFCLVGDGSFYLNVQELKTIVENNIKIKIVIFNNNGYLSIRETQRDFLNSNFIGTSKSDKTDVKKLVEAFGLKYFSLKSPLNLKSTVFDFKNEEQASVLEVFIDPKQRIIPFQYFKKMKNGFEVQPLENMAPALSDEVFNSLMINKEIL